VHALDAGPPTASTNQTNVERFTSVASVATRGVSLSVRTVPSPSTDAIRPLCLIRAQSLYSDKVFIRLLSVRSVQSVFNLVNALHRAAHAQHGNSRSGWHQQIVNTDNNGSNGLNGQGKTSRE
jgi:hypothetical protein